MRINYLYHKQKYLAKVALLVGGFYGISTIVSYLTPNPLLCK